MKVSIVRFPIRWWWLTALILVVYGSVLEKLVWEWWTNDNYTHGFLMPLALAYFFYVRRKELSAIPAAPSFFGFIVVLTSQAVLILGTLGAEFFLQRFSFLLLFAGLILFLWGWPALSRTAFGLLLIFLAIPLPAIVFNAFALPLQLFASACAEFFLDMVRIPVLREGNILELPNRVLLNVAEACSGIRSLISLLALATTTSMFSYFLPIRWWLRVAIILSAVPIAIAANAFRVAGTGILAYNFGEQAAQGFFHSFSGMVVSMLAYVALLAELFLFKRLFSPRNRATP